MPFPVLLSGIQLRQAQVTNMGFLSPVVSVVQIIKRHIIPIPFDQPVVALDQRIDLCHIPLGLSAAKYRMKRGIDYQ